MPKATGPIARLQTAAEIDKQATIILGFENEGWAAVAAIALTKVAHGVDRNARLTLWEPEKAKGKKELRAAA